MQQGFILQSSCRLEDSKPVIHHYGRLVDGASFLIRETRQTPHFYISNEQQRSRQRRKLNKVPTNKHSLAGTPLIRVEFPTPNALASARDTFQLEGIPTYESDIPFPQIHLVNNNIRGGVKIISSNTQSSTSADYVFEDPEIQPADVDWKLQLLAIEVEILRFNPPSLAIALYDESTDKVLVVDPKWESNLNDESVYRDLSTGLKALQDIVDSVDPDVLLGRDLQHSGLVKLLNQCRARNQEIRLGRTNENTYVRLTNNQKSTLRVVSHGRLFIDTDQWIRQTFPLLEKRIGSNHRKRVKEGYQLDSLIHIVHSRAQFNFQLVHQLKLPQLAVFNTRTAGVSIDPNVKKLNKLDSIYLRRLRASNVRAKSAVNLSFHFRPIAPVVKTLRCEAGIHHNVGVFTFNNFYPNLIRIFNIDWLTLAQGDAAKSITAPNDVKFDRQPGILPLLLEELLNSQETTLPIQDQVINSTIKSILQSLVDPASRFHDCKIVNAIWSFGRHFIKYAIRWFEEFGCVVIFNENNMIYVSVDKGDSTLSNTQLETLAGHFNEDLSMYIKNTWDVDNLLNLDSVDFFSRFFLTQHTSKKEPGNVNFAAIHHPSEHISLSGPGFDRKLTFPFINQFQQNLYHRVINQQDIETFVLEFIEYIKHGSVDHLLEFNHPKKFNRLGIRNSEKDTTLPNKSTKPRENRSRFINYVVKPILIPVYHATGKPISGVEDLCQGFSFDERLAPR